VLIGNVVGLIKIRVSVSFSIINNFMSLLIERKYTQLAITNGAVTEAQLDVLLKRLFRVRLRLGHFDPVGALGKIGPDQVCNDYAIELARDSARQSVVVVKNTNNALPLKIQRHTARLSSSK
jgi:beta-glucosidase-like glycosyl hydrolase